MSYYKWSGWGVDGDAALRTSTIVYTTGPDKSLTGMVEQNVASDAEKNQISRWADAASKNDDRSAYEAAVHAMARTSDWGESGPNWYTSVSNGGWYAYSDVTTMLSTTIAQRHPDWVTAVGTTIGTAADVFIPGARLLPGTTRQDIINSASDSTVNIVGETVQENILNPASGEAVTVAKQFALPWWAYVGGLAAALLVLRKR